MTAVGQKGRKTAKSNQLSKKSSSENDSISSFLLNKIKSVPPATRLHLLLSLLCTFVQLLGLPAAQLFPLDPSRPYEVWRIITSMTYFGPPSLYMANSLWFMVRYGQTYESEVGSVNHLWFLIIQTLSLSIFGFVMGYRYQARSLLAAVVYASSQLRPTEKMRAQFGLTISSWQMPFLLMALDCLSVCFSPHFFFRLIIPLVEITSLCLASCDGNLQWFPLQFHQTEESFTSDGTEVDP
jgi:hypothetical protein